MSHSFVASNFSRPTYCDHCQGLLWGLVKQGYRCSGCGAVCHQYCQNSIPACSIEKTEPYHQRSTTDSPAAKSLRSLQQQHSSDTFDTSSSFTKIKRIATSDEFQNVLVSAAINSTDTTQPVNDYLANLPPLNPQNTAKNFSRFVSRCGPMFAARDNVILLLSWNKPIDTLVALLIYCIVCLHPKLVLLVPHVILLQIIITGYNKKKNTDSPQLKTSGSASTSSTGSSSIPTPTPSPAPSRFSFAAAFFPAFDEASPEYLKNMQNLQNMMGEMSDLYDLCASNAHHFDWSSEQDTMRIFQGALVSLGLLCLGIWFVPLNIIFLVGGISMFLLNTRFAKFVVKEMLPQVTEIGQSQMDSAVQWYTQVEKRLDDQVNFKELSLYENQRWWSGSGFIPHMLPDERGLWSDFSGAIELAPKEELPAPKGYHWMEDNWSLDKTGPWTDDTLGLEMMVYPESGGWVYSDNNWENARNNSNNTATTPTNIPSDLNTPKDKSVTRRRRWIRKCELDMSRKYSLTEQITL
ncbi:hypothetical protein MFLAVUS_006934 [Mucor flavus]|uniref:Phorbol-ester/DAG-type domain-containing protein n=1 Tax=Mucor flavus TaxID=439312 RepID=A0ABP9Z2X0_9FUNG